jgi:hypothetical protein
MDLKESNSAKRKARRDHTLVWEARPGDPRNLDQARMRVQVDVAGDRASSLRAFWKLPEDFVRARERQNFLSISTLVLFFGVLTAGIVFGTTVLVQNVRHGLIPWKTTLQIAVPVALLTVVSPLLSMQLILQNYSTAIPLELFRAETYLVVAMSVVFAFVIVAAAVALIASSYPDAISVFRRPVRRTLGRDAAFALLAAAGLALLLRQIDLLLLARFHSHALFSIDSPDLIVSAQPSLAVLTDVPRRVLYDAAALVLLALLVVRLPSRWMLAPFGLPIAFALMPLQVHTAGELLLHLSLACLTVGAAMLFCFRFARGNYLAYALTFLVLALRGPLAELYGNGISGLSVQGGIVAAAMGLAIVWAIVPAFRRV